MVNRVILTLGILGLILLTLGILGLILTSCNDPKNRESFTVEAVDGRRITLNCPVYTGRGDITNYDGKCIVTAVDPPPHYEPGVIWPK